jgi:hypothetical protein
LFWCVETHPTKSAAAEARGRELDIWETARELLAELEAQVQEEGD